jgi:hypothetical protein
VAVWPLPKPSSLSRAAASPERWSLGDCGLSPQDKCSTNRKTRYRTSYQAVIKLVNTARAFLCYGSYHVPQAVLTGIPDWWAPQRRSPFSVVPRSPMPHFSNHQEISRGRLPSSLINRQVPGSYQVPVSPGQFPNKENYLTAFFMRLYFQFLLLRGITKLMGPSLLLSRPEPSRGWP